MIISYVVGVEFVLQQLGRAGYAGPEFASTVCHEAQDTMAAKANKFAITAWLTIRIGNIRKKGSPLVRLPEVQVGR